jgi:hypothetical protein
MSSIKYFKFRIKRRIFKNRKILNLIPLLDAMDICDDNDFNLILYRWCSFTWLTIVFDLQLPVWRKHFKRAFCFPPNNFWEIF